jgi:hypothetical protein
MRECWERAREGGWAGQVVERPPHDVANPDPLHEAILLDAPRQSRITH